MIRLSHKKMSNDYDMERVKSAGEEINVHEEMSYCSTPKDSARFYASKPYGTESKPHPINAICSGEIRESLKE
jgi:hypothetical protein